MTTWRLATFNVNGIRARLGIVRDWVERQGPDVLCLQETKCQDKDFPERAFLDLGYTPVFRGQKSYNGVALIMKGAPDEVRLDLSDPGPDEEARFIAARTNGIWVVNTYVPQGRAPDHPAFQSKLAFFARLLDLFGGEFSPQDPLVWTGDMNVAPQGIDVFDPEKMAGEIGCHPDERRAWSEVAAWGFTDLFRHLNPDEREFTFWDYRLPNGFKRNLGWRLDHVLVTSPLVRAAEKCVVDRAPRALEKPSDHTPVLAEFDLSRIMPGR